MKHFLFVEAISGEQFIVGEESYGDACVIAEDVARDIGVTYNDGEFELMFEYEMTDDEAEASGLDEY